MFGTLCVLEDTSVCDTSDLHPSKSADVIQKNNFKHVVVLLMRQVAGGEYLKRLSGGTRDLFFQLAQHILKVNSFMFGAGLIAIPTASRGVSY